MATIVIRPSDYKRLGSGKLDEILLKVVVGGVHETGRKCLPLMRQRTMNAVPANPSGYGWGAMNTGAYRDGWDYSKEAYGAVVFNSQPYSPIIEEGRKAGAKMPPTAAIEAWAATRLNFRLGGRSITRAEAWAIARAISRRGLRAREVMIGSLPDVGVILDREIQKALTQNLGAAIDRFLLGGP